MSKFADSSVYTQNAYPTHISTHTKEEGEGDGGEEREEERRKEEEKEEGRRGEEGRRKSDGEEGEEMSDITFTPSNHFGNTRYL